MPSLFDLPHHQAKQLLATGATVYLTVNPVEYHGPHLSLHNDRRISEGLVRDLHARLEPDLPLLWAADLEVGVEPAPGPGTRAHSYSVVRTLTRQACTRLADLGAKRVILMTFHGAPMHNHALQSAVHMLWARSVPAYAPMNTLLSEQVGADPRQLAPALAHMGDPALEAQILAETTLDMHAGFVETSLAMHYAPDSVAPWVGQLPPCPPVPPNGALAALARLSRTLGFKHQAAVIDVGAHMVGWTGLRPFPGYTGRPGRANPTTGAWLAGRIIDRYAEVAQAVFAGTLPPPEAPFPWLVWLTLGGRLPVPGVPDDQVGIAGFVPPTD